MGSSTVPAATGGALKPTIVTLTSGTSWTVPTGVTNVNVTIQGGGGGGGGNIFFSTALSYPGIKGNPGQMITTNLATTPGASIAYAIGAGGTGGAANTSGGTGGTTTFTGATSATGGLGGIVGAAAGSIGTQASGYDNGGGAGSPWGGSSSNAGGVGGAGKVVIEYWT